MKTVQFVKITAPMILIVERSNAITVGVVGGRLDNVLQQRNKLMTF